MPTHATNRGSIQNVVSITIPPGSKGRLIEMLMQTFIPPYLSQISRGMPYRPSDTPLTAPGWSPFSNETPFTNAVTSAGNYPSRNVRTYPRYAPSNTSASPCYMVAPDEPPCRPFSYGHTRQCRPAWPFLLDSAKRTQRDRNNSQCHPRLEIRRSSDG